MRRKKVKVEKHNTKFALFFVIFVCLIILISLIFKAVEVVLHSKFDGYNRFTISVSNNKKLRILSFSPNANSISVINIVEDVKNLNIYRFLAIPVDGFVQANFLDIDKDASTLTSSFLWGFRNVKTNLTFVDLLRLFLVSKTIPSKKIKTVDISTSLESLRVDKIIDKLLNDEKIEEEDQAIEIINATSATGLGARLGRLVANMGGKVVQISTENIPRKTSMILYNNENSYTVEKLHNVLGFRLARVNKQFIGDITILIGEDSKHHRHF